MTISESTETFFNKKIVTYDADVPVELTGGVVYRLAQEYDDEQNMSDLIDEFLAKVDPSQLDALIIGAWATPAETGAADIIAKLIALAPQLPNLRALFIGDMTYEECEISWIIQGEYTPLLNAYPRLEALRIRGSTELVIDAFSHASLRELTIECGGLPGEVTQALAESTLPALERLELWVGTDEYGFSGDVELYRALLAKLVTPKLTYLGLRDAEIADELARWLAGDANIAGLSTLDLSLGTIGDVGALALADSAHVSKLTTLNLSHHYISDEVQEKLRALPLQVLLDDAQEEDDGDRYVAVGE